MIREYNKLVRDKIPEILDQKGIKYGVHQEADHREIIRLLIDKVDEEAKEIREVIENPAGYFTNTVADEIGDLYEVLDALTRELGLDADLVGTMQAKKLERRGGFQNHTVLEWTEDNQHSTK